MGTSGHQTFGLRAEIKFLDPKDHFLKKSAFNENLQVPPEKYMLLPPQQGGRHYTVCPKKNETHLRCLKKSFGNGKMDTRTHGAQSIINSLMGDANISIIFIHIPFVLLPFCKSVILNELIETVKSLMFFSCNEKRFTISFCPFRHGTVLGATACVHRQNVF